MNKSNARLKEEFKRLKLSQAGAARAIGESGPQRLREVIAGRQRPPADLLSRLPTLGVDVTFVLTGVRLPSEIVDHVTEMLRITAEAEPDGGPLTDEALQAAEVVGAQVLEREQTLLTHYRACNEKGKQALDVVVATMAVGPGAIK